MPNISVLLPVYNAQEFLVEAMESILNQSFKDFEFIIINDGSTDNSKEIIKNFTDERIKYVENEQNIGLIATLNKGLDLAAGKYIARMDADDIVSLNRLSIQLNFMDMNPEIGVCGSYYTPFKGEQKFKTTSFLATQHEKIFSQFFLFSPIPHPVSFIRSDILTKNNIRYNENYTHAEDLKLWFDISKYAKLANIPQNLLLYRLSPKQISNKYEKIQRENTIKIRREILSYFFNLFDIKLQLNGHVKFVDIMNLKECFYNALNKNRKKMIFSNDIMKQIYRNLLYAYYISAEKKENLFFKQYIFSKDLFTIGVFSEKNWTLLKKYIFNSEVDFSII
jgi:glycosyltransferase involved in cell wall biosynthesis